jgi:outer membrane receptor for ferrienterochelin and colicins
MLICSINFITLTNALLSFNLPFPFIYRMKKNIGVFILLAFSITATAQYNFSCRITNAVSKEAIHGATVVLNKNIKTTSNQDGSVKINNIPKGSYKVLITHTGFAQQEITVIIPQTDTLLTILLILKEEELEEVIVSSSRTNSRIEDLPTKVEVLGSEEVGEENGIKPGNIASLLGDVAGIQIQQTSAATGNADARIQGLPGKYTQILRDGLPLFGGYSGSFSILQIPPSDLKQIEIIKGASSTLYGGGAIAGMINLVSKTPKLNSPERAVTINQSTLKESNINAFFSNRSEKFGYTFFTGGTYQKQVDVNKDELSDVPNLKTFFLHPRLFFYPNKRQTLIVGYNLTYEERKGGDMKVLQQKQDNLHQFFIENKSARNTVDAELETKLNATDRLIFKGTTSFFNRDINTNVFGMKAKQFSYFSELSYLKKLTKHTIVAGANFNGENFTKKIPDSTRIENYQQKTIGLFIQDDWKLSSKFTAQPGMRFDNNNDYGSFFLPRLSLLYKLSNHFTTRLGGGFGYKIPTVFASDIDERDYPNIFPNDNIRAERSQGVNWDINYKQNLNDWHLTINQMFYMTGIERAVINYTDINGLINFYNAAKPINTKGFETYVAATHNALEIYLGYTYTLARQLYSNTNPNVSLSARNKFASVIAYEFSEKFRAGIEAAYTGKQYLDDGTTTSPYLFAAAMMRYNIKNIALVLNCENLFDYRQTKKESIYTGSISNPVFKQIWAPLDGRVINLSAKISW